MGYEESWYLRVLAPNEHLYLSRSEGARRALYSYLEGNAQGVDGFTSVLGP